MLSAVPALLPKASFGVPSVLPRTNLTFELLSVEFPANISLFPISNPPIVPPAAAVIVPCKVTLPVAPFSSKLLELISNFPLEPLM